MAQKNYPAAVAELQVAVRLNPEGAAEHRVLGQVLLLAGKSEQALPELEAAVHLNPASALAHHELATALYEQDDLAGAEKEFREAVRLDPLPENHYGLAACLMTMSRNEEALAELEIAAKLAPSERLYRARKEELLKLMQSASH
jgi:tetratricopeptide (TPR) repeat protein